MAPWRGGDCDCSNWKIGYSPRGVSRSTLILLFGYALFMAEGYANQLWLADEGGTGKATDFLPTWAAAWLAFGGMAARPMTLRL